MNILAKTIALKSEPIKRGLISRLLFDENGFNKITHQHKETHTKFGPDGYDIDRYNRRELNAKGWDRAGIYETTGKHHDCFFRDEQGNVVPEESFSDSPIYIHKRGGSNYSNGTDLTVPLILAGYADHHDQHDSDDDLDD